MNEVELLILVTPELVAGMDADQVPPCGPGMQTASPNDWELYLRGYVEVPNCCSVCNGKGCAKCADAFHGGAAMPAMMDAGEGRVIEMHEIPSPQPRRIPALPSVPAPRNEASPAPEVPPAASSVNYQKSRPVGATETSAPKTLPVSTGTRATSELPGLIGPIGYDSAG
jgi:pilus assembly protein CpaC